MKKVILFFIFSILCLPVVFSLPKECYPKFNIDLNLVSKVRGSEENSDFQFNYFKEADILWVDKLSIYNFGDCDITGIVVHLNIRPQVGYKFKEKHSANYNDMLIPFPDIGINKTVTLVRSNFSYYHFIINNTTNKTYGHWGIDLDETGDWIISYEIRDKIGHQIPFSANFWINRGNVEWFKVITLLEASLIDYNKTTLSNNIQILWLTRFLYILTGLLFAVSVLSYYFSYKSDVHQTKELKEIKIILKEVLEKIPRRIEVKIENKKFKK